MHVLRSLLFYLAFYLGSVVFVLATMIAAAVAPQYIRVWPDSWSRYHRKCLRLAGIRVRETGSRPSGPALYAFKHESFFEAIDLPAALDHPVPFAKQELFDIPGWGRAARAYGSVAVARTEGARALRDMLAEGRRFAATGRPLAIFPEGTRVPHGTRPPLQAGFAGIYKVLRLPVVPVAVDSGPLYHRLWKRPGTITLHFGDPIEAGLPREEIEARVLTAINALNV
jgi:1-acyl-sn-glycerol-3-phosphate acyltransferase